MNSEPSPIKVKRKIYEAARILEDEALNSNAMTALQLAGQRIEQCQAQDDKREMRFWADVHIFLLAGTYLGGDIEIVDAN
jgi:hypothetical protein